jgi:hypothetical protein
MERNLSNSPPRRRVRSEVLKTTEERLELLRQELSDLRHAEETHETRSTRGEHANTQFIWCKASQNNFDQICKFFLLQVIIDQELETLCICSLSMLSYDFWAGILIV